MVPDRETYLRIVRRQGCGMVPCNVGINYSIWERNVERLERLRDECPHVNIRSSPIPERAVENIWTDEWGCVWHFPGQHLDGQVIEHPLSSWGALRNYKPPSPSDYVRKSDVESRIEEADAENRISSLGVEHGFLFLKLTYLRGFQNFMLDVAEDRRELYELRDIVADYWYQVVRQYVEYGLGLVSFGDDLGLQDRLPISPRAWRRLIAPSYQRLFSLCRDNGIEVYLHTDGYVVDIIPDLIETGVTVLNPQDLVNGLDNLERLAKGKVCIALDIDRQSTTVFGTPEEVTQHIRNCIVRLGSPEGGLSLGYGVYPGTPVENIEAAARAMEEYHDLWAEADDYGGS
jgi:hypothetical protein